MRIADHFLTHPSPLLPRSLVFPGCPDVPLPSTPDGLNFQQRWDRSRLDRLSDPDMLSVEQVGAMLKLPLADVLHFIDSGRAIALQKEPGEYRLPYWQFFEPLWSRLPLIKAARRHDCPWSLLDFLEHASEGLRGMTPRAAIERGHLEYVLVDAEWGYR